MHQYITSIYTNASTKHEKIHATTSTNLFINTLINRSIYTCVRQILPAPTPGIYILRMPVCPQMLPSIPRCVDETILASIGSPAEDCPYPMTSP